MHPRCTQKSVARSDNLLRRYITRDPVKSGMCGVSVWETFSWKRNDFLLCSADIP